MIPEPDEHIGQSEYSQRQTVPFDMNDEISKLAIGDHTHELSDEEIRYNVYALFRSHDDIDEDDIRVECMNGVVILKGLVDNKDMSQLCTRLCEFVPGVKEVVNALEY